MASLPWRIRYWRDPEKYRAEAKAKYQANLPAARRRARLATAKYQKTAACHAKRAARHAAHPEVRHELERRWRKANPTYGVLVQARYRAAKLLATPAWSDRDSIRDIYGLSRMLTLLTGVRHEVDHIVPLVHDLVCGLHVEDNLMVVTAAENRKKRNVWSC